MNGMNEMNEMNEIKNFFLIEVKLDFEVPSSTYLTSEGEG